MRLWRFIRKLKPGQLWKLCKLCGVNLLKIWPTWRATNKSVAYATRYYGKWHHKNTPANAFRHALWSYLIAAKCLKREDQVDEVIDWALKITDLHEELYPNEPIEKAMDLHNNHLGVHYFRELRIRSEEEIVSTFRELTQHSVRIAHMKELEGVPEDIMVHLINMDDT